jgi:hypothetical protein
MKLKKVTKNDPLGRLAVSVRSTTLAMLETYRAHYRATYGEEIERSQLVDEILRDYMQSDKAFLKARAGLEKAAGVTNVSDYSDFEPSDAS